MSNKVVMFSGGYDSTYALIDVCEDSDDEDIIYTLSVDAVITGEAKNEREKTARKNILKKVRERYPKLTIREKTIKIDFDYLSKDGLTPDDEGSCGLPQPMIWSFTVLPVLPKKCELYFSYIHGDCASQVINNIKKMFQDIEPILFKTVDLKFPLLMEEKSHIIYYLCDNFPEIVDFCTSCEGLDAHKQNCGRCVPCLHLKTALVETALKAIQNQNERVKNWALDYLKNVFYLSLTINLTFDSETKGGQVDV